EAAPKALLPNEAAPLSPAAPPESGPFSPPPPGRYRAGPVPLPRRPMPAALSRHLGTPSLAMGAGVLLALSMPPFGLYPLAWVALVPLLVRWERLPSGRLLFLEAYVTFLLTAVGAGF